MQSLETRGQLKTTAARRPREAAYWRAQLGSGWEKVAPPADLPGSSRRPDGRCQLLIDAELAAKLDTVTRQTDATLEVLLAATVAAVIARLSAARELVLGHPAVPEVGGVPPLATALPLRVPVDPAGRYKDLLNDVRGRYLAGLAHQDFPIEVLGDEAGLAAADSVNLFFDVAIEVARPELPSLAARLPMAILVRLVRAPRGLELALCFDDRRYTAATIERLARTLVQVLVQVLREPEVQLGQIDLMLPADRAILARANDTTVPYRADLRLDQVFAAQARATPDAIAVRSAVCSAVCSDEQAIRYAELNRRANRLAHTLRERGVVPDQLVAVAAERSVEMLVGILGILKAGGAYLPIDPGQPRARIDHVLHDSGARVVVAQARFVAELAASGERTVVDLDRPASWSARDDEPELRGDARSLAYAIYTSGSTGLPKGALIEHHSVLNRIDWMQKAYPIGAGDVILQKTPIAFDVSVWELFWWSFVGGSVCLLAPGGERDPEAIIRAIERHGVTTLHFVPSMLNAFLDYVEATDAGARLAGLRRVFASGEALGVHQVTRFARCLADPHGVELVNLYGPTEATVDVSHYLCTGRGALTRVPIGRPIDNIRLHVVDEAMRPQPIGVPGELCIAGVGLARGYHDRPELTRERFVEHPFPGEPRIYRTGDLARWLPDGEIEYLGRIDHQVKVRGYRIELAEIEHHLRRFPDVQDAVVIARRGTGEQLVLHGYVQAAVTVGEDELRRHLGALVPDYMIPARFVTLPAFPVSPNGKLDRKALPEPASPRGAAYQAPRNPVEAALVEIWQQVLRVERVGIHDNFFALGGTSIDFVTVLAKARNRGVSFTFQQLFAHPTIARLGEHIASAGATTDGARELGPFELLAAEDRARIPADVEDAYPMTMLQAGLIFQNELSFGTAQYHDILTYVIQSRFDEPAFVEAVRRLVRRNAIFRTSYHLTGFSESLQLVRRDVELPLEIVDLRHLDEDAQQAWLDDWLEREKAHRFDWERGGLVRLHVHVLRDDLYRYTLSQHNSALDGWSITLVHTQLFEAYYQILGQILGQIPGQILGEADQASAASRTTRTTTNHLRSYVALEQQSLASPADQGFWSELLAGARFTELTRWQPEREAASLSVIFHDVDISAELSGALIALADRLAVPIKSVLLAAHVKFLSLASGQADVVAGYEHSGRPELEGATESIGLFLNTIPFRIDLGSVGSWEALIRGVYAAEARLLPHRRYPMAKMKHDLSTQEPLFETAFNYTHFYLLKQLKQLPEFDLLDVRANSETEFTLRAEFSRHFFTDQVKLSLHYHEHVFSAAQVQAFAEAYQHIFEQMVAGASAEHAQAALRAADHASRKAPRPPRLLAGGRAGDVRASGELARADDAAAVRPLPESEAEQRVAAVWAKVLDLPAEEIFADDNFFDLGGNSLMAMRVVVLLQRQVSLADFMKNSTLRPLARKLEDKRAQVPDQLLYDQLHDLLHDLSRFEGEAPVALVCFPYAGGNAINFQPLADELRRAGAAVRVFAVDPPGHDAASLAVGLAPLPEVTSRIHDEIQRRLPRSRLVFWGHCVGSALALETARRLQTSGRAIEHLFIGGKLYPELADIEQSIAEVSALSDAQVVESLAQETGYIELESVGAEMAMALGRVFRHDSLGANRYLAEAPEAWAGVTLRSPITIVIADDDALTPGYAQRFTRWRRFAGVVELRVLRGGGHYFCRTQAGAVAQLLLHELASSRLESSHG